MLGDSDIATCVSNELLPHYDIPIVLDPVLVATSGATLTKHETINVFKKKLIPRATLITPNAVEASALTNLPIPKTENEIHVMLHELIKLGCPNVLLKGGHLNGTHCCDYLFNGREVSVFKSAKIEADNTHGTGCTLAAACTAYLAKGELDLKLVVKKSKSYLFNALKNANTTFKNDSILSINHFYRKLPAETGNNY